MLLHDMTYVDAGAEVGSDDASMQWHRTTASLHMRNKIAPRLRELVARDQLNMAKVGA